MKTFTCKNCGAVFDAELSYCPYCKTMNKKSAYAEFRTNIVSLIDSMLQLKVNLHQSVGKMILSSFLRSLFLIAVIAGIAYAFSQTAQVNYYNYPEYDQKAYKEILWMNENLDKLNTAYDNGDYNTIENLFYQQQNAVRSWYRYPSYSLKNTFKKLTSTDDNYDVYKLRQMLYFIFMPEFFAGHNGMNRVEKNEYDAMKETIVSKLDSLGYPFSEAKEIYEKCSDSNGLIDVDALKECIKEDSNGKL